MFANPLWSVLIILGLLAAYIAVRIKHGRPLFDAYARVPGWAASWWAWLVAFRTWVVTFVAGLALALPDLIVQIAPIDLSPLIGESYAKIVTSLFAVFVVVNNVVLKVKPAGEKAA